MKSVYTIICNDSYESTLKYSGYYYSYHWHIYLINKFGKILHEKMKAQNYIVPYIIIL